MLCAPELCFQLCLNLLDLRLGRFDDRLAAGSLCEKLEKAEIRREIDSPAGHRPRKELLDDPAVPRGIHRGLAPCLRAFPEPNDGFPDALLGCAVPVNRRFHEFNVTARIDHQRSYAGPIGFDKHGFREGLH